METKTARYHTAFGHFLRKGMSPYRVMKADHPTPYYVWRTRGDAKVRSSHAANNGQIFAWDNPPPTGNPGEDYNCRCGAEPYVSGETEYAFQTIISNFYEDSNKWNDVDFLTHFFNATGKSVTLSETGHLTGVRDYYFYELNKYNDVNAQIIDEARKNTGAFEYSFGKSYGFKDYLFVLGGAVVKGVFRGTVTKGNGYMSIRGTVQYLFSDVFTDIFSERQERIGTSKPSVATPELLEETEHGGKAYEILGVWITQFSAYAKERESDSMYQWNQ